ncbi:MAG TPA: pyrroline-5-carboxylate reductase [Acidiferrobacteraceae bacterium]|mgnify:CR=1 FL=1|nr:pyrroline-5-carboxylate reductase [Acidiferrobacteraceae bacterium]
MATKELNIGFVGGGNMGRSLAGGLLENGWAPEQILIAEHNPDQREAVLRLLGLACEQSSATMAAKVDVLVLAIKPQDLKSAIEEIAASAQQRKLLVLSIVAGVREQDIQRWLGGGLAIVRAMPNTPALVGSGATGLYANALVSEPQRDLAESILRAVGITVWLDEESLLDVVTALSGSGPAYYLMVMEALEKAAVAQGLTPATARLLTLETAYGTAKMALESREEPAQLRRRVTSPGGTTERAIDVLNQGDMPGLLAKALTAATTRSRELAELLGQD